MKRKLQVFVSSTFEDLKEERQAAVLAILNAGHIPAGMELFSAGDESQKETIKRWIQESDIYLLILGGRYGTLDQSTGLSYTHWEYNYAGELGKPRFAIVISDKGLNEKIRIQGPDVIEKTNPHLYQDFKKDVQGKMCKFFDDTRDIQLAIFQKMPEFSGREDLVGWVYGADVPKVNAIFEENSSLRLENNKLKEELDKLSKAIDRSKEINNGGINFEEVKNILRSIFIQMPESAGEYSGKELDAFSLFIIFRDRYATGVTNQNGGNELAKLLFFRLAPSLLTYDLVEKVKITGNIVRIQTSKAGYKFLQIHDKTKSSDVGLSNESELLVVESKTKKRRTK